MTVSEVCFIPNGKKGKCECCQRENQELGTCNALPTEDEDGFPVPYAVRCIDCFFGPPPDIILADFDSF